MIPLVLTSATSAANLGINKRNLVSGIYGSKTTTITVSNEEIKEITKKVKSIEDCGLLIKSATKNLKSNEKTKIRISGDAIRYISCKFIDEYANRCGHSKRWQ